MHTAERQRISIIFGPCSISFFPHKHTHISFKHASHSTLSTPLMTNISNISHRIAWNMYTRRNISTVFFILPPCFVKPNLNLIHPLSKKHNFRIIWILARIDMLMSNVYLDFGTHSKWHYIVFREFIQRFGAVGRKLVRMHMCMCVCASLLKLFTSSFAPHELNIVSLFIQ